jgi:hypothetical protein
MSTSMRTRSIIALVVAGIAIPATSAVASPIDPVGTGVAKASRQDNPTSLNATLGQQPQARSGGPAVLTSVNATLVPQPQARPSQPTVLTSVNATLGPQPQARPSQSTVLTSVNATVGPQPQASPSVPAGNQYASVNAVTGDQTPPASAPVAATPDDGFDWFDAMLGALAGIALLAMTIALAGSVTRHRRTTAESRV